MAKSAIAATKAAGLKVSDVFVPRPSVSPAAVAEAKQQGHIVPSYDGQPAPLGISDFGLSNNSTGGVVASELNTTSVLATANLSNVLPENLVDSSPDGMTIQENAVLTNVTLFGTPGYSFWTQNVIVLFPTDDLLELETNVWNFSGGPLSTNVFYQHGPYGVQVGTEYYYASYPLALTPFPVLYPFNLALWMNSSLVGGRDAMSFTVQLTSSAYPSEDFTASNYDYVIFNSTPAAGGPPLANPSPYTANGYAYNPIGLPDDFELTFGGPGGGSQASLFIADGTLGLYYLGGSGYQAVPSAFNFGGETGETSTGANIAWTSTANGPVATMTTGPAVLSGLWNASLPEGSFPVTLDVTPANAFATVTPVGFNPNFTVAEPSIAPTAFTNTLYLAPGTYDLSLALSGYDPVNLVLPVAGPQTISVTLVADPSTGVYTPLWAFNNTDVAALAVSGAGTPLSPYQMPNDQSAPLSSNFGLYNDYGFPAYAAVFFENTTATTEFANPPSFNTSTSTFQFYPGAFLPAYNDLQYWFWNVSNVAVVNASNISGWFDQTVWYPLVFDTFNVIFYEGGDNLIANDTFNSTDSQGLLIFSGGGIEAPPFNIGGQNYTVWGNVFNTLPGPNVSALCALYGYPDACYLMSPYLGLGLQLAGSNDTVYNNEFLTPSTAWQPPENLYSGFPELFTDAWNITPEPASVVNYAPGFPTYPLTGVILGPASWVNGEHWETDWQGGNYWWDYGLLFNPYNGADNPYGVLPYDENGLTPYGFGPFIFNGGDYAPILPYELWTVTFTERGLPAGDSWDVQIYGAGVLTATFSGTSSSVAFYLPDGLGGYYTFNVSSPSGYYASPSSSLNLNVYNHNGTVAITFSKITYSVKFTETGLTGKTLAKGWTVSLGGVTRHVTTTSTTFVVDNGTFPYLVSGPSGYVTAELAAGNVVVSGLNLTENFAFSKAKTLTLSFSEKGLGKGQQWCVEVQGDEKCTTKSSLSYANLTTDSYSWSVVSPTSGQTITPSSGTVSLTSNTHVAVKFAYDYAITFSETGLSTGTWSVTLGGATKTAAAGTSIVFDEVNATYGYKIGAEAGYTSSGTPPKAVVAGADTSVAVTFTPKP